MIRRFAAMCVVASLVAGGVAMADAPGGQCKPADAKAIALAEKRLEVAKKKVEALAKDKKATIEQKAAAEQELASVQAEIERLECKAPTPPPPPAPCKPADGKAIEAAQKKLDAARKKATMVLANPFATPALKAEAKQEVVDAEQELAKLECKTAAPPAPPPSQCKPADAKAIALAEKKVTLARSKLGKVMAAPHSSPQEKEAAVRDLEAAQAELAKATCK